MDLSKLPRMSKTDTPHNDAGPAEPLPPGGAGFPVTPAGQSSAGDEPAAPVPFVKASAWCPNCGAPLAPASKFCNSCGARLTFGGSGGDSRAAGDVPPGAGIEGWISIGVALFLILLQPRFFQWASSRLFHTQFSEFGTTETVPDPANPGYVKDLFHPVPYTSVPEFWMDLGPAMFSVVLILDGIILAFVRRKALVAFAFVLTLLTTIYNLGYVVMSFSKSGFAPISFLAVLFGGFMCYHQWSTLQWMRATNTPRRGTAG